MAEQVFHGRPARLSFSPPNTDTEANTDAKPNKKANTNTCKSSMAAGSQREELFFPPPASADTNTNTSTNKNMDVHK